jgi:hypothetical protein
MHLASNKPTQRSQGVDFSASKKNGLSIETSCIREYKTPGVNLIKWNQTVTNLCAPLSSVAMQPLMLQASCISPSMALANF